MKKKLERQIEIPEGVEAKLTDGSFFVKGPEGENSRTFPNHRINITVKDGKIIIESEKSTKNEKKIMNTIFSHIKNMVRGVEKKFEYHLKICYDHFPFTLRQAGNEIFIKNFLGEKKERVVEVPNGVELEIKKDIIIVKSVDKEIAGQASANFEKATRIKGRDKRTFQDGIYITKKDGKSV